MLDLRIKKMSEDAIIPKYAHKSDAGMDLYSIEDKIILPGESELIHTGIAIQLPKDTEAQIRPRSGLALKHSITVLNTPGTIDEGYRGEICIILINHSKKEFKVEKAMRIAQMVIKPVLKVNVIESMDLTNSDRGEGGFGSTGTK
ncbi:dUTP diphosphatase [Clostridium niameyense]|uniref:Deoxyuridine 5'-triphosphate nucleotidohydrolase n=1 Tax=Clostridium niameyense TaxID=1622073 RepID=A0A6M0RAA4_9CLOT|nr:dUTP diphosphatase [Clostridium niameyense]NEZ46697.1 dUTP diphosphatase [Clostridium niameyense]